MLITKEIGIDMGHRIPNHKSKCCSVHGHRYQIEVGVNDKVITTSGTSDEGMVIDFGDLKQIMMDYIDKPFDHGFCIYEKDDLVETLKADKNTKLIVVDFIPTAENLAKHWFLILNIQCIIKKIRLQYVKVWETPTSTAKYERLK